MKQTLNLRLFIVAGAAMAALQLFAPVPARAWSPYGLTYIYDDRAAFLARLDRSVTDDYENPAYRTGDRSDLPTFDIFSNAAMNAIFGETIYRPTGFPNLNIISGYDDNHRYCSGCNGSYEIDLTSTSVGGPHGVFGVGLDVAGHAGVFRTIAFVTYGDNTIEQYPIPTTDVDLFWGISSPLRIKRIHFGLINGGINTNPDRQRMAMDNLTLGNPIPEPTTLALLAALLTALHTRRPPRSRH